MCTTSTGLGYATTIHAAQGVSADTMHGLFTGQESRQQLYTMLTRGRHANHLYLQVVGDGDPHTLIRPDTISPRTPTETLQQILARDEAPVSASTLLRELNDPAARLFQAVQRYTDGLHVAAEQLVGPQTVAELDQADQYVPGLTTEPAWPTLRAHLLALAAETGEHPLRHLLTAASGRDLRTAGDMAAVLYWRLPELTPTDPGPLPWLPGIPATLHDHPVWGDYLAKRSQLVADLADQVQDHACQGDGPPAWAPPGSHPSTALIGEIAVWRAANGVVGPTLIVSLSASVAGLPPGAGSAWRCTSFHFAVLPAVDLSRPEKDRLRRAAVDRHGASFVTDCVGQVAVDIGGNKLKVERRAVGEQRCYRPLGLGHTLPPDRRRRRAPSKVTGSLLDHSSAKSAGSPFCIASAARG